MVLDYSQTVKKLLQTVILNYVNIISVTFTCSPKNKDA